MSAAFGRGTLDGVRRLRVGWAGDGGLRSVRQLLDEDPDAVTGSLTHGPVACEA